MNSEIRILKLLLNNRLNPFTIRKISKELEINYRIAYEKVILLEKEGLIKITKAGNSKICEFTDKFNNKVFEAEYERRKDLFKNKDFKIIFNDLSKIKQQFIAILFGSYAKGNQTKHSDIDLLIVTENEENERNIDLTLRIYPFKIHPTYVTYEHFVQMIKSKEFTVVSEALKKNYIIIGIEDFYRAVDYAH